MSPYLYCVFSADQIAYNSWWLVADAEVGWSSRAPDLPMPCHGEWGGVGNIGLPVTREAHTNCAVPLPHRAIVSPFICRNDKNIGADHEVHRFALPSAIASTSAAEMPLTRNWMKRYVAKSLLLAGASQRPSMVPQLLPAVGWGIGVSALASHLPQGASP